MDMDNEMLATGPELAMCTSHLYRDKEYEMLTPDDKVTMALVFGADAREVENKCFPMRPGLVSKE